MQTQLQDIANKLAQYLTDFWFWLMKYVHRGLILLQRFWTWWRSINWPRIPLSPFQWLALLFTIFSLAYLWATPVFEASDELWHFGMVEALSDSLLPVQDPESETETIWRQEGSQPPLYYALAAALISPIDISDADSFRELNPHGKIGIPGHYGNKNLVLHDTDPPPLQGTLLAVYLIRLMSIGMALVTLRAVYKSARLISPQRPAVAWLATAITAFNPMFIFISASVNNDNLVIMFNSLVVYLTLLTLREGFDWRRSALIAILIALGSLSKLSALVLVPAVALAALWTARRTKDWRGLLLLGSMMLVVWATLAGWWYLRNIALYGELFGTATMAQVAGIRQNPFTLTTLLEEFQGFRFFYWGIFGAASIQTTPLFYAMVDLGVFISLFGLVFLIMQLAAIQDFSYARWELTGIVFLLGIILPGFIAVIAWTAQTYASQGRLMFPFIAAISPLLAAGFVEIFWWSLFLLSPPDRSFVRAGEAVSADVLREYLNYPVWLLAIAAFIIPFTTIAPEYAPPPPLDTLPDSDRIILLDAEYEDIELVAYSYDDRRYTPGMKIPVTFYWRVLETSDRDYSLAINLIEPGGEVIGKEDTYPGGGTLRTSTWEAGKIYADEYRIETRNVITGRYPFDIQVDWWHLDSREYLEPVNEAGEALGTVLLDAGAMIAPPFGETITGMLRLPEPEALKAEFSERIRLSGFRFGINNSEFIFEWTGRSSMTEDYTAFVHIYDADGNLVGQRDVQPELPTRYWLYDEPFITRHPIIYDTPDGNPLPGEYTAKIGWYNPESDTFERLRLPLPEDIEPAQEGEPDNRPDTLDLITFTVDSEGNITSEEYDTLWEEWMQEPPPAEQTVDLDELMNEATADPEATIQVSPPASDTDSSDLPQLRPAPDNDPGDPDASGPEDADNSDN